jgi:glucose-1-phosphate thymidylyltransferase
MDVEPGSELVGLIPAAGHARRLRGLSCSKEIVPVGFPDEPVPSQPAAFHLLRCLRRAGIRRAYVLLRNGKWDIPACLGSGDQANLELAYLVLDPTPGIPYTLDRAYPFVKNALVALGFPDTLIRPRNAYVYLIERQRMTRADVVLGLFPVDRPDRTDMVEVNEEGRVTDIAVKDPSCSLSLAWCIAVWTPAFTHYLHDFLAQPESIRRSVGAGELYPGHVIRAALLDGLHAEGVDFSQGEFLDIGTPEELRKATGRSLDPEDP